MSARNLPTETDLAAFVYREARLIDERRFQVRLEAALESRPIAALQADLVVVDEADALGHAGRYL